MVKGGFHPLVESSWFFYGDGEPIGPSRATDKIYHMCNNVKILNLINRNYPVNEKINKKGKTTKS